LSHGAVYSYLAGVLFVVT